MFLLLFFAEAIELNELPSWKGEGVKGVCRLRDEVWNRGALYLSKQLRKTGFVVF